MLDIYINMSQNTLFKYLYVFNTPLLCAVKTNNQLQLMMRE